MKRTISLLLTLVLAILAASAAYAGNGSQQAAVSLLNAGASLAQTSDTSWTLKKTGVVDSTGLTVTWTITATEGATVSGHLVVYGFLTVYNSGAKGATIGNIVINLQTKSGNSWETQSSDISDATHGDAATSAHIDPHASSENESEFTTNAASGKLDFMDANDNTVFSLKPQKTIAPGASVSLLFSAGFDNNTLKLANGTAVRVEVIVSFGNSTSTPPSAANVDINGNGQIDADEAWVRSIPARITMTVPSEVAGNQSVTLSDTASDIATTGTVAFSSANFNLGTTSGTATVSYDGGSDGGKLTNCAHLMSASSTVTVGSFHFPNVNGIDLQACDTESIGAAGWNNGDLTTYGQAAWGGESSPLFFVNIHFGSVYSVNPFLVGDLNKYSMLFTGPDELRAFFQYPQNGTPGVLTSNIDDPFATSAGALAGELAALKLNTDFSDAGLLPSSTGLKFGDLYLCNLGELPAFDGQTVRQFLTAAGLVMGASSTAYTPSDLDTLALEMNVAFEGGSVTTFAQQSLATNSSCQAINWQRGDFTTYSQPAWAEEGPFATLYTTSGFFIGDLNKYSMGFSGPDALKAFFPQAGTSSVLTSNVDDPQSTSAGALAGELATLKLNIDFSDAGLLPSSTGLKFGDLYLCNLSVLPAFDNQTVRQFLAAAGLVMGASSTAYTPSDLATLASELNAAFAGGSVSTFAQQSLRQGPCQ